VRLCCLVDHGTDKRSIDIIGRTTHGIELVGIGLP